MIDHVWSVLCSKTVTDKESNNVSLFNVTEQLNVEEDKFPSTVAIELEIASLWARARLEEPASGYARIRLLSADGSEDIKAQEYYLDLTEHRRLRTRTHLQGIPVKSLGVLHFQIEMRSDTSEEWKTMARIPLEISIREGGPEPATDWVLTRSRNQCTPSRHPLYSKSGTTLRAGRQ